MLVPLLTWSSASSDPLLQSRLTFNASALPSLQQSNLTLVLAIGHPQCGKSAVLDSLLPDSRDVFKSPQVEDAAGVFISAESVKIGDNDVVLMEMTGIDFKHSVQAKKLLYVLLPVCSGVVACLEKTDLMKNLNQLLEVNQAVESDGRAMGRCQFLTMIEGASLLTGRLRTDYENFQKGQFCQKAKFIARGMDGISAQATEEIKREILQMPSFPSAKLEDSLAQLTRLSECCLTYRHFKDLTERHREEILSMRRELSIAQTLNLLSKTNRDITVNEAAFTLLAEKFQYAKEISLVVILGQPGLGKSTLLNRLLSYMLRLPSPPDRFKVGNTTTHTTLESQMLSMLFSLPDSEVKVMLVDLEGLDGTETLKVRVKKLQQSLIAAILAMASLPCLLISNTRESLTFIEEKMKDIAAYRQEFGLVIERILLLFNDKVRSAGQNQDIVNTVERCKHQYSLMDVEVKIINKPSFVSEDPNGEVDLFLGELVAEFDRPKRFVRAGIQSLVDILSKLREIINLKKEIADLEPTEEEELTINHKVSEGTSRVEAIFEPLVCHNDQSLEGAYRGRTEEVLRASKEELVEAPICVRRLVESDLQKAVDRHLPEIREMEQLHEEVYCLSQEQMRSSRPLDISPMESAKNYAFSGLMLCKVVLFWRFWRQLSVLNGRFLRMTNRYINSQTLTTGLRQTMSCVLFSTIMAQVFCWLALSACIYCFVFEFYLEMYVAVTVVLLDVVVFTFYMRRYLGKWPNRQGSVMMEFGKAGMRLVANPFVGLKESKVLLIVVVGPRRRGKSAFLNGIAASISCFALENYPFFTDSKGITSYQFTYVDRELQVCKGVLVDIAPKKASSKQHWSLKLVTCSLLRKASKAYFYVPNPGLSSFLDSDYNPFNYRELLEAYSQSRPLDSLSDLEITVLCVHFTPEGRAEIEAAFREHRCRCVLADFNPVNPEKRVFREFRWELPRLRKQEKEDLKRTIDDSLVEAQSYSEESR